MFMYLLIGAGMGIALTRIAQESLEYLLDYLDGDQYVDIQGYSVEELLDEAKNNKDIVKLFGNIKLERIEKAIPIIYSIFSGVDYKILIMPEKITISVYSENKIKMYYHISVDDYEPYVELAPNLAMTTYGSKLILSTLIKIKKGLETV